MLKRTSFKRKQFVRPPRAPLRLALVARTPALVGAKPRYVAAARPIKPIVKVRLVRSRPYRMLIASLPCGKCGIQGYTQACHGDLNKALGKKTCDTTCWPGCGPHDGLSGCHYTVGSTGQLAREERRSVERQLAVAAQLRLIAMAATDKRVAAVLRSVGLLQ